LPGRVERLALVSIIVEDGERHLRVVRPRTSVHVVGAEHRQYVVDHDDLRMNVDRRSLFVLEVVYGEAIAAGPGKALHHGQLPEPVRGSRDHAVSVGVPGHDHDEPEFGGARQCRLEQCRDLFGPEILILDVDEGARPDKCLGIHAGDGPLAVGGEGIRGSLARVRAQHLYRVAARSRRRVLERRQRVGGPRFARSTRSDRAEPEAAPFEGCPIVPTLAERLHQIDDGWSVNLRLDVVPRRSRAERGVQCLGLRVSLMTFVVATSMAEVDTTDESEILVGVTGVQEQHQLLVVRPAAPDACVQEQDPAGIVHHPGKIAGVPFVETEYPWVGAPQKPSDLDPSAREVGEQSTEVWTARAKKLIVISTPIREQHLIANTEHRQAIDEPSEVRSPMDQRLDMVTHGPSEFRLIVMVVGGHRIAALLGREEPIGRLVHPVSLRGDRSVLARELQAAAEASQQILGIFSAIGGFVDIGDLVFNTQAGATFGFQLLWVVVIAVLGIIVYSEMCGRGSAIAERPFPERGASPAETSSPFALLAQVAAIEGRSPSTRPRTT
jgi:hypothetical protein